jgi:S-formylglutathione hydrolase FrmB
MDTWRDHNPTDRAADLKGVWLYVASGTGTPGGGAGDDPGNPGAYGVEHGIFHMNVSFTSALDRAGVAHTRNLYPGGYHGWRYWQRDLHEALPGLVRIISR